MKESNRSPVIRKITNRDNDPRRVDAEMINALAIERAKQKMTTLRVQVMAYLNPKFWDKLVKQEVKFVQRYFGTSTWHPHQGEQEMARRRAKAETGIYGNGRRGTMVLNHPQRHRMNLRGGIR